MSTLLVTATLVAGQEEARGRYLQGVFPLLVGAGGTPVKRLRVTDTVTGSADIGIALVMDFDNSDALKGVFESDGYQALIADRDLAFDNMEILIAEDVA